MRNKHIDNDFPFEKQFYLTKINGKTVTETLYSNYGFTVAFLPTKLEQKMELTDIREIFKLIKKYR